MSGRVKNRKSTGPGAGPSGGGGGGNGGASSSSSSSSSSSKAPPKLNETMKDCWALLKFFQQKPECTPFAEPVDWEAFGLNDYPEIIKHPMDLGTIETKFLEGKYSTPGQFESDMKLVWQNAMTYNRPDSDIYRGADRLMKSLEKRIAKIKSSTKTKVGPSGGTETRAVTRQDRLKLSQLVAELKSDQLGSLVEIIQRDCPEAMNEEEDEEIEIEINNIDDGTLLNLIQFASTCVEQNQNSIASSSSKQPQSTTSSSSQNNSSSSSSSTSSSASGATTTTPTSSSSSSPTPSQDKSKKPKLGP